MAQKVSASVAEALKVDLHIRGSRCGTFRRHPQGFLQPHLPKMMFCLRTGRCAAMTTEVQCLASCRHAARNCYTNTK